MWTPSRKWPLLQPLDRNRIVEVAGVLAVDRDDVEASEIRAAGQVLLARVHGARQSAPGGQVLSLRHRRLAVSVGQPVLADDDRGVHPGVVDGPKHLGHPADRPASPPSASA